MKNYSLINNVFSYLLCVICIFISVTFGGCYSFTGGAIPEHLKTLYIGTVDDNSRFGNPAYRDLLTQQLFDMFRNDNSFTIVETGGDARLQVTISAINDETLTVESGARTGELEKERKITVTCDAEYYDTVLKKSIWKKPFRNYGTYDITNAQIQRDEAVKQALKQNAEDILLAVVSGW